MNEKRPQILTKKMGGVTLIELVAVVVILGILASFILPKVIGLSSSAKIGVLNSIVGSMRSTIDMTRIKAHAGGLRPVGTISGSQSLQTPYIVDFGWASAEIDHRNLCPESQAELADRLDMPDFLELSANSGITSLTNNQYTLVGYDIPGFSLPTNQGCYIIYDSFGIPDCTLTVVTADC
jgi:MSHA pilin protein MshA